jgi:hypothetical protein
MNLKTYIEELKNMEARCNGNFKGVNAYYHKHGKEFSHLPLSTDEEDELRALLRHSRGTFYRRECWKNAAVIAVPSKLTFCEGYGISKKLPIPINHAWVCFKGRPIDVTWGDTHMVSGRNIMKRIRRNIRENEYFGVEVDRKDLVDAMCDTKVYDSVVLYKVRKFIVTKLVRI